MISQFEDIVNKLLHIDHLPLNQILNSTGINIELFNLAITFMNQKNTWNKYIKVFNYNHWLTTFKTTLRVFVNTNTI